MPERGRLLLLLFLRFLFLVFIFYFLFSSSILLLALFRSRLDVEMARVVECFLRYFQSRGELASCVSTIARSPRNRFAVVSCPPAQCGTYPRASSSNFLAKSDSLVRLSSRSVPSLLASLTSAKLADPLQTGF